MMRDPLHRTDFMIANLDKKGSTNRHLSTYRNLGGMAICFLGFL